MRALQRLSRLAGVVAGLMLLAPGPAGALDGPSGQIEDVRTKPGQVQFVFAADGLTSSQKLDTKSVKVIANDVALTASATEEATAASSTAPLRTRVVVIAIDSSGSMEGEGITAARAAALEYAKALPTDVRVGLVAFADTPRVMLAPTANRKAFEQAVQAIVPEGNTALFDGIIAAVQAMASQPADAERHLVVMSDGDDTVSTHPLSDAVLALNSGRVLADVVAFKMPTDATTLNQIASSTNGRVLPATNADELAKAFATAATAFSQQVVVTVKVPDDMAGQRVSLTASMTAGSSTVRAMTKLVFPAAAAEADENQDNAAVKPPQDNTSAGQRWLVVLLGSVAVIVVAGAILFVPGMAREETERSARLTEVGRYRIVQSLGGETEAVQEAVPPVQDVLRRAAMGFFERLVSSRGNRRSISDRLDRAGIRMRPEEWVAIQVSTMLILGAVGAVLLHSILGLVIGVAVGWFALKFVLKTKTSRRVNAFGEQLPDVLQLVAGSLRSGFSLNQAIASIVSEGTEPTASEFARALTEVRLGSQLEDALDRVADRMQCIDLHLVVMAVRISREVGGNLAEVLMTTVSTMRERGQLKREVKVLSAEGRLSAKILIGLPFMMLIFLLLFKPGYIEPLYTTGPGYVLIAMGVGAITTGSLWVNKLIKIEV